MDPKYLRVLEFDKILDQLASHCAFSASEELARALLPSHDTTEITRWQGETTEARSLLDQHPEITVGGARDVRSHTRNARLGATLAPLDLLEVQHTMLAARTLRRALARLDARYPQLTARAAQIQDLAALIHAIGRAVSDRGEILDSASDELARIRRDLNVTRTRLMDKLQKMIGSPAYAPVLQEPIITQRAGRYVLPIRTEAKGRVQGIVHDTSASGATTFVEPLSTVEMGNRVVELERAEAREVERILRELTALVAGQADGVSTNVEALAQIDLAFAKAKYADQIRAVEVTVGKGESILKLLDARHPLLDPEKVVPVSVHLGEEFSILIITGPNTGGKTVTLKSVGLLALMAQSGMHIPAREGSRVPVYSGIYADIGDEQSIEQSLSTFSSHLRNITEILRKADAAALVLLDELGAGTDPVEGSALARAILSHLLARGIPALVATHYAELKAFAQTTPGVQNASVEFDVETLSPTYHLTIGLPGQSNAFAIASRLGLDATIIANARSTLAVSDVQMEKMLAEIKNAKEDITSTRAQLELERRAAEKRTEEARRKLSEIEAARQEILERARQEARAEVERTRAELERLRQEWRAGAVTREFVEDAREKLEAAEKELLRPASPTSPATPAGETVRVGDRVFVARLGQTGQVIALDGASAEVRVGNFRVQAKLEELTPAGGEEEPRPESSKARPELPRGDSPGLELNLRGLRADDAIAELDRHLDRAYLAGLPFVRVIHGKGTGTLRKITRELLQDHPLVAEIREAEGFEGGEGVTIAKLVARD